MITPCYYWWMINNEPCMLSRYRSHDSYRIWYINNTPCPHVTITPCNDVYDYLLEFDDQRYSIHIVPMSHEHNDEWMILILILILMMWWYDIIGRSSIGSFKRCNLTGIKYEPLPSNISIRPPWLSDSIYDDDDDDDMMVVMKWLQWWNDEWNTNT